MKITSWIRPVGRKYIHTKGANSEIAQVAMMLNCPCKSCPHETLCKNEKLACELFTLWVREKTHLKCLQGERRPSPSLYRKVYGDA